MHFMTLVIVDAAHPRQAAKLAHRAMKHYWVPDISEPGKFGKCDSFVIGGSYDQMIYGAPREYNLTPQEYDDRYGFHVVKDENNIRLLSEIPDSLDPYAIIDLGGSWSDCESHTDEEWQNRCRRIFKEQLEDNPTLLAVVMDCHC